MIAAAKRESNQCSATSMVVTLHWRAHSFSVEKAADEISATGSPRRLSPIDVSHLGVNGERPGRIRHKKKTTHEGWLFLCGLYWTRTSDPIDVNDVLYQLSQQTITGNERHYIMHFVFGQGKNNQKQSKQLFLRFRCCQEIRPIDTPRQSYIPSADHKALPQQGKE